VAEGDGDGRGVAVPEGDGGSDTVGEDPAEAETAAEGAAEAVTVGDCEVDAGGDIVPTPAEGEGAAVESRDAVPMPAEGEGAAEVSGDAVPMPAEGEGFAEADGDAVTGDALDEPLAPPSGSEGDAMAVIDGVDVGDALFDSVGAGDALAFATVAEKDAVEVGGVGAGDGEEEPLPPPPPPPDDAEALPEAVGHGEARRETEALKLVLGEGEGECDPPPLPLADGVSVGDAVALPLRDPAPKPPAVGEAVPNSDLVAAGEGVGESEAVSAADDVRVAEAQPDAEGEGEPLPQPLVEALPEGEGDAEGEGEGEPLPLPRGEGVGVMPAVAVSVFRGVRECVGVVEGVFDSRGDPESDVLTLGLFELLAQPPLGDALPRRGEELEEAQPLGAMLRVNDTLALTQALEVPERGGEALNEGVVESVFESRGDPEKDALGVPLVELLPQLLGVPLRVAPLAVPAALPEPERAGDALTDAEGRPDAEGAGVTDATREALGEPLPLGDGVPLGVTRDENAGIALLVLLREGKVHAVEDSERLKPAVAEPQGVAVTERAPVPVTDGEGEADCATLALGDAPGDAETDREPLPRQLAEALSVCDEEGVREAIAETESDARALAGEPPAVPDGAPPLPVAAGERLALGD
jgi:hypothetical protein